MTGWLWLIPVAFVALIVVGGWIAHTILSRRRGPYEFMDGDYD